MEFLTVLLAAVLGILSSAGFVADRLAANAIRQQVDQIEDLSVRIDSTPNYRLLQGRADRVRIAGRGVFPIAGVRIDTLEVETDPIALNIRDFNDLKQPIRAGVRLVLTREDLSQALRSDPVADALRDLSLNFVTGTARRQRYDLVDPQVQFLPGNRVQFRVSLVEQRRSGQTSPDDRIEIAGETGLEILSGKQLNLVNPQIQINNEAVPPELVNLLFSGISQQLDLDNVRDSGVLARILRFQIEDDRLTVAAFVQLQPDFNISNRE